ncbi:Ubiquitin thioesterase trabid [Schistosoma japonicum]|uniref:Ubiquitin thioesterase trabid n=1 Tax=Schistosoma japonicum TaxID=6182 RepID=A0A4Z2DSB8_SCHJA|nr:Ubiquitin thioesterase ZRANB1 [Schistosoma japonicum]KAH8876236.1 Ubiquitin thioesterase ZRANB1 [Schistosoma japonicum]TNN19375.1 Ubiquitin thioesterase trabid [Schistosoma japonicum]
MDGGAKWPCAVCTYDNWPAAFKCTLCGTPRSSTLIEDEMQRLHLSSKDSVKINESCAESAFDSTQLTKCQSCTYLNQRQNFKCEQCFQVLCDSPVLDAEVSKQASSTWLSPPLLTSMSPSEKWTCIECTYENWPKSKHCVMCFASSPQPLCVNDSDEVENKDNNLTCVSSNSSGSNGNRRPKSYILNNASLTSRDRLWLSACIAVANGDVAPIERYILGNGRIERKLTKHECRYLNSNIQPTTTSDLSSTLSTIDNFTRHVDDTNLSQLSDSGCYFQRTTVVSSDSGIFTGNGDYISSPVYKFRSGWTLVDLALRFCRTDLINLFIALVGLQATSGAISVGSGSKHSTLPVNPLSTASSIISPNATTLAINATTAVTTSNFCTVSSSNLRNTTLNSPFQDIQQNHSKNVQGNRKLSSPLTGNQIHPALQLVFNRTSGNINKTQVSRSKFMPCQASPHIAGELRDLLVKTIRHRKGDFPCAYFSEWGTFALPYSITKFPAPVKQLLLSELCDMQAQSELEDDAKAINWWFIPGQKHSNRLFALWNRTAGDCLLDSVLQACWGVFDRENCLRRALADSLQNCEANFYPRWRDYEAFQAACHYILDEDQCQRDWENVLTAACQPREALEQIHIFALSHVLRRPIIVYGVKYIKNYRGEPIGIANFQGIYLPLLWERCFCSRNPIVLGFTRGHFTALVPIEPYPLSSNESTADISQTTGTSYSPYASPRSSSRRHSPTPLDETCTYAQMPSTNVPLSTSSEAQLIPSTESSLASCGGTTLPGTTVQQNAFVYLPLVDRQGVLLPIHFTTEKEAKMSHTLLQDWLDVVCTRRGLPLARLRLHAKHKLVDSMVDEWLDSYRSLIKLSTNSNTAGFATTTSNTTINTNNISSTTTIQHSHLVRENSSSSTSISSDTEQVEHISKSSSSSSSDALRSSGP